MAQVNLDIGDNKITAVITRDARDELGLKVGDRAIALIKFTEVMLMKGGGQATLWVRSNRFKKAKRWVW